MRRLTGDGVSVLANVVARLGALVSLALATVIVARIGGPPAVGVYALLRVLPGLAGVLVAGGLPSAVAYFLAGNDRADPRLRPTIVAMALVGGCAGTALWLAGTPLLGHLFFRDLQPWLVAFAGLTVLSQLLVATGKGCCQGSGDIAGANWVILLEELAFLPAYGVLWALGGRGVAAIVAGLLLADLLTAAFAWPRLERRGFFHDRGRPSAEVARRIWSYGMRGQIGGVLSLVNLRLDFAILDAIAGVGVLGTYAVASKFAELLRLVPLAMTYVLYPRYARDGHEIAATKARRLLPMASGLTVAAALPLGLAAIVVLPAAYGQAFRPAILPAEILLVGLAAEGAAGVISAFLYGDGRPGLNSIGMGAGVVVTVALDLLLIPRHGAIGAAVASSAAYLTSTAVLLLAFWLVTRGRTARAGSAPSLPDLP